MKASVIIPLYNTEDFIERAILSAVCQDLDPSEMEVIVVNDGSTDNSLSIAENLAAKYPQVKVFSKQNEGLSKTRNFGIDHATGDYLFFLDSDDYFFENVLGSALKLMEADDLDLLSCDYLSINESGESVLLWHKIGLEPTQVMSGRDYLLLEGHHEYHIPMTWSYGYRRGFLNDNHLRMISFVHEDVDFSLRAMLLAKKMRYEPMNLVYYYQRSSSITNSYKPKYFLDQIHILSNVDRFVKEKFQSDKEVSGFIKHYISDMVCLSIIKCLKQGNGIETQIVKLSRQLGIYPYHNTPFSSKKMMFNTCPRFYFWIYKISHRKN